MADETENENVEPAEKLSSKERRKRARATNAGPVRAQRTPEQRDDERRTERARKAKVRRAWRAKQRERHAGAERAAPDPDAVKAQERTGRPKERLGIVVSSRADKTITVRVDMARRHRRYEKIVRRSSTLHAHDEHNHANQGDTVRVVESRPLSRTKRWRLVEILERAK